ncbi:Flp pilus assembly protein CpaB [bacterium]|nr:Flp pilus assembly protein CpaB [bacterium]
MKNLTPAKLVMLVFVAMAGMIVLYVVKTLTAREVPPPVNTTRVIPMFVSDVEPGTVITEKHVGRGPWLADDIKDDVLLSEGGIIGRVVKVPIEAATPIHGNALYAHGELPPLSVSQGYRAVTVSIREQAAIMNGLIKPGDFVDIQFTPKELSGDPRYKLVGGMSIKLFKGVRVLALNRNFVQSPLQATENSVTLEIAEQDTGILELCSKSGELTLQFTKVGDGRATVQVKDPNRPTLEEILQLPPVPEEPEPPVPPEPDRFTSRIYRQSALNTVRFQDGVPTNDSANWVDTRAGSNDPAATDRNAAPGNVGNGAVNNVPAIVPGPGGGANPYAVPYGSLAYPRGYGVGSGYGVPGAAGNPYGTYGPAQRISNGVPWR